MQKVFDDYQAWQRSAKPFRRSVFRQADKQCILVGSGKVWSDVWNKLKMGWEMSGCQGEKGERERGMKKWSL